VAVTVEEDDHCPPAACVQPTRSSNVYKTGVGVEFNASLDTIYIGDGLHKFTANCLTEARMKNK